MKNRIQKFLEEVVDCQLPVEQQSIVFALDSAIGGYIPTDNSGCEAGNRSCVNRGGCDSSVNTEICSNYDSCNSATNNKDCFFYKRPTPTDGACSSLG